MHESNAVKKVVQEDTGDWLSALLDGELPGEAGRDGVAMLAKDPEARQRWRDYALIGDALRGQAVMSAQTMARFQAALAEEPTLLAPLPHKRNLTPSALWLAAAATVAGITWTVLSAAPDSAPPAPLAAASVNDLSKVSADVLPYLAAHQDYAHAVLSTPEMNLTQVTLSEVAR